MKRALLAALLAVALGGCGSNPLAPDVEGYALEVSGPGGSVQSDGVIHMCALTDYVDCVW